MSSRTLSVIIPAFNEEGRLGRTLEAIVAFEESCQVAHSRERPVEILVIDDGSRDGTADLVRRLAQTRPAVTLLVNESNHGKGFSVRRGMLAASGDLRLMCDADLCTPIEEIDKLMPWIEQGCDVVIGSRDLPDSRLDPPQPLPRRLAAWTFRAIRRRLLLPQIRDTQCGFKLFTRRAAEDVFSRATIDGWLFDCEVLGLAERLGYAIREVGVGWGDGGDSRVRMLPTALHTVPELLRIRRRLERISLEPRESS